jgi:nucleotide-binding universal stress UspA family protein
VGSVVDRPAVLHVVGGPGTDVICDLARRERADLVVLGMRGMSGAERFVFGSTTEGVLRKAEVSVLVVPGTWTAPQPDSWDLSGTGPVIVGVDLSMPSLEAAAAACRFAAMLHTSVEAVHVVTDLPVPARWRSHAEAVSRDRIATARHDLGAAIRNLTSEAPVTLRVESGAVAPRLADMAAPGGDRHPILVLGRRTHPDRAGAPGAIAYRVLTLSPVPVMMHL